MARPSKLTINQCEQARQLRPRTTVAKLAKRFRVSESSMYKVLDGTYAARKNVPATIPNLVAKPVHGSTPSVFKGASTVRADLVRTAQQNMGEEIDDITLAAAELIVAKAHYARAIAHSH